MNQDDFLAQLRENLYGLPKEEIHDIVQDYKEHFQIGLSKGKSEEEISKELGEPKVIAGGFINPSDNQKYRENRGNDSGRRIVVFALLVLFNLIIVVGPYFGLVGLLIGFFGLGIGSFFGGIGLLIGSPFVFLGGIEQFHFLTIMSFSIGFTALGILIVLLGVFLAKLLYKLTVKYIKWNIDIING